MADLVFDGPVGQLTVVPYTKPIKGRTMGHVALFGLDGLPFTGGGADLVNRGYFDLGESYKKGDYVTGPQGEETEVVVFLATEDIPAGGDGPMVDARWSILALSLSALQVFSSQVAEIQQGLAGKVDAPVQIADLGFDPADQQELESAVSGAVSSLTTELNLRAKTSDVNTSLATRDAAIADRQLLKPKLYLPSAGQIEHIATFGHSLTALGGPVDRPSARLSSYLTGIADDLFYGVSGSDLLIGDKTSSGWGRVWNEINQKNASANPLDLVLFWSGLNGLSAAYSSYSAAGKSGDMAREAIFSYLRLKPGTYQSFEDSRFAYSSGWGTASKDNGSGQLDFKYGQAGAYVDETVTIAEGGTHAIYVLESGTFGGCVWEISENGTVIGTLNNAANVTYSDWAVSCFRIPNLVPGSTHTYRITLKQAGAAVPFGFFLGSGNESSTPPVILDVAQFIPASFGPYQGSAHVPTAADVQFLNERIRANASLFDDYVQVVETSGIMNYKPGFLLSDLLHLAPAGGKAVAIKALQTLLYRSPASLIPIDS